MAAVNALPWKGNEFPTIQHLERHVRAEMAETTRRRRADNRDTMLDLMVMEGAMERFRMSMVELRAGLDPRRSVQNRGFHGSLFVCFG